jgi:uncharacterized protein (UPF0332 family)
MSTPSKQDIIRIKVAKAARTLLESEKLIEFNYANAAISRLYYACFYAATALLFSKDIFTKTHSGVKQMLGLHFIEPAILSRQSGIFYSNLFMKRLGSDYDDFAEIDLDLVKEYVANAKDFIFET